jgi:putative two-component system response regulator
VVDVFDALISWRPYKEPWTVEKARMVITEGAGSQFDPDVVAAFITVLDSGDIDNTIQLAGEAFQ